MAENTIRPLYPTDLLRYILFLRDHPALETDNDLSPPPNILDLFGSYPPLGMLRQGWVSLEKGRITGLLAAKAGPGLDTWEIERWLSPHPPGETSERLLERLCQSAISEGIQKIFLRLSSDSPLLDIARSSGFHRYSGELIYHLPSPPLEVKAPDIAIRPRLGSDNHALFRLYCASVPARVRQVEGWTMQEWRGAEGWRSNYTWQLSWPGFRRDFVLESQDKVAAWLICYPKRGRFSTIIHPENLYLSPSISEYALSLLPKNRPILCTLREYQMEIALALANRGFQRLMAKELLVKFVTARVQQPAFRPVRAWGGPFAVYSARESDIITLHSGSKNGNG